MKCIKAHNNEVTCLECINTDDGLLIITSGRDRFIHMFTFVYRDNSLEIFKSFRDHTSSINSIIIINNGKTLISSSNDKNIIMRRILYDKIKKKYKIKRLQYTDTAMKFNCLTIDKNNK